MNIHIKDIDHEISTIETNLNKKKALRHFIEANLNIFTNCVSISTYSGDITIWNPLECIEEISKTWGQSDWVRVPQGKEFINWERKIGDFTITLQGMEKCAPTFVPLSAWPITLKDTSI